MSHWEYQTLQCTNCKEYPAPSEEAWEDAAMKDISFHVYEYKVSFRKDGKKAEAAPDHSEVCQDRQVPMPL